MINYRAAGLDEAAEVAALHVAVWRETYGHLAPAEVVAALGMAQRLSYWTAALTPPFAGQNCVLAKAGGQLAGFISFGPASHPAFGDRGEIKHLYVNAAYRKSGVARALLGRAFAGLHSAGFADAGLAVLRENSTARLAYARLGGVEAGEFTDAGPLWKSANILVVWEGLRVRADRRRDKDQQQSQ